MKTKSIGVRLTDEDKGKLDFIMKKSDKTISEAVREAIDLLFEKYISK